MKCLALALPIFISFPSAAAGGSGGLNPTLNQTWTFRLGAGFLNGDTKVRSDLKGDSEFEGIIDLDDLGIDGDTTTPYFNAHWRFAQSWRLDLEYFGSDQDGSAVTSTEIDFGDIRIPVGVVAESKFNMDIYNVGVGWSFVKDERKELGIGLGLHVADLKTTIAGSGFVNDISVPIAKDTTSVTAPLPNVRLYGGYAFTPQLALEANFAYFDLSYDKYDGRLTAGTVALEWRPNKTFGAGVGYTFIDVNLEVDSSNSLDVYNFELDGPVVYVTAGF